MQNYTYVYNIYNFLFTFYIFYLDLEKVLLVIKGMYEL